MADMTIRPMAKEDWAAVAQIYQAGIDTNIATFQTECPTYEDWDASHMKTCRLVAQQDGEVLGWAALTPVSSRCVYAGVAELSVYIAPEAKGKGVGKALLDELCRVSEAEGIWTLQSGILEDNIASIRLHEKCGFRTVGYRERIAKDRFGIWRNTLLMERRNGIE